MASDDKPFHVYHGSDWPEYEDRLVGDRSGLLRLREAIDDALENGESSIEAGEFVGVSTVETSFFEAETSDSFTSKLIAAVVALFVATVFIAGFIQVGSWIIELLPGGESGCN